MIVSKHKLFLERAMKLAEKGRGHVSPNPVVGAVLVRNGKIIAEDWHRKFGEGHAERNLLEKVGRVGKVGRVRRTDTLYVTLEPCCHTNKKTKPCTDIILESGVKRVVVGVLDPNPEVSGKGVALLRKKGVEIIVIAREGEVRDSSASVGMTKRGNDVLELLDQLQWQNRFFFKWVRKRLPWVAVKAAQSLDGRIGKDRGKRLWLTGKESSAHVHRMRAQYDAILVGVKTVIADNPQLTVRNPRGKVVGPQPASIILDAALSIPLTSHVVRPGTIIFCGRQFRRRKSRKEQLIDKGCVVLEADTDAEGYLNLREILAELAARGIASVYVEGGPSIWSSFLSKGLADELMVYFAPRFLGEGIGALETTNNASVRFREMKVLGEDIFWWGTFG